MHRRPVATTTALADLSRAPRKAPTAAASPTATTWAEGSILNGWLSDFNGFGTTSQALNGDLILSPKASTSAGETHAALATTVASYGDVDVTTTMTTDAQLRTGSAPNAWEVGWLLWHHADNTHFYYLALKPNGLELGKEDPAYAGAQRFLVTLGERSFPVGSSHLVRVTQVGNVITVWVDGAPATTFTDDERPYTSGHVGVYDEDSVARFSAPVIAAL